MYFLRMRLPAFFPCMFCPRKTCVSKVEFFFFNRSKAVLVAHCCFPCLALVDKESASVRQGQTYKHDRQGEQQRATRTEIYALDKESDSVRQGPTYRYGLLHITWSSELNIKTTNFTIFFIYILFKKPDCRSKNLIF